MVRPRNMVVDQGRFLNAWSVSQLVCPPRTDGFSRSVWYHVYTFSTVVYTRHDLSQWMRSALSEYAG